LLQQLGFEWSANGDEGDETGYFATGDRDALEAVMLAWLKRRSAPARRVGVKPGT